jgi:hypothetical protein
MNESYIDRYAAVPVPLPIRTIDSIDARLEETEHDFFNRIIASFKLAEHVVSSTFQRQYRIVSDRGNVAYSCDMTSELWLEGVQPLGLVLKTRDDSNFQVASFAKMPLVDTAILRLDSLAEFFQSE